MYGVKNAQYVWSAVRWLPGFVDHLACRKFLDVKKSHRAKRTLIMKVIRGFSLKHISFVKWPKNLDGGQGLPIPVPGIDGHHLENDHLDQCSSNNHLCSFHVFTSGSFAVFIDKIHCSLLYSSLVM